MQSALSPDMSPALSLDDGSGLRVVRADFVEEKRFDWDLFSSYAGLRVLTYSASTKAIVRMLDEYSFNMFECVFGYEGTLQNIKQILAFQKVVVGDTRSAIMGLEDKRHIRILERVAEGRASFRVLRKSIAHAKLYLLEDEDAGRTRVIVGSANLSEQAFSGSQSETLVVFDNDSAAWKHYTQMFNMIRNSASDEIPLPDEQITTAEIEAPDIPIISDHAATVVVEPSVEAQAGLSVPVQIERIDKVAAVLSPRLSSALSPVRSGKQRITPKVKRELSRVKLVKSVEDIESRYFCIDRPNRSAILSDKPFELRWEEASVKVDSELILGYFGSYEGAFEGDVEALQRD